MSENLDKQLIKSIIKEMVEDGEIALRLSTFKYHFDYDCKVTSAECVKNIIDEVDVIMEISDD